MSKYPLQPGVAWTDAQIAEWEAMRAKGFSRFVLRFGLTFFIPTAIGLIAMLVIAKLLNDPPDWLWTTPVMVLPGLPFVTAFIAYFFAKILWRDFEARYNESLAMRGTDSALVGVANRAEPRDAHEGPHGDSTKGNHNGGPR
jgi:hypothetical protein